MPIITQKNASTSHISFALNYGYHFHVFYKKDFDPFSKSKSANELSIELRELITICRKNLHHAQKLQKQAYNKAVKLKSYVFGDKIWLNSKYIKTKRNRKLETKFFGPFQVLYLIKNHVYKLKLQKKWRIYDVFYVSLLEYDTIKKGQIDETTTQLKFETGNNGKKYKVEAIRNSAVYARELEGHLPDLYYLVL